MPEYPTKNTQDRAEESAASSGNQLPLVSALSPRALVIGVICVAITCVVVCFAELVDGQIQIGYLQLPPVVIGMLSLILAAQAVLSHLSPRLRLKSHELFTIYAMMLLAAMISSRGLLEKLIPLLVVPNYFANTSNDWRDLFFSHIPKWAVPFDLHGPINQYVATRFFDSLRPGERLPWNLWVIPLLAWGVLVIFMFTAFLCLAALIRRQWADNEKLSFPLIQLPLEMVKGVSGATGKSSQEGFLKNRITWIGFSIPALIFTFNGFHQWYPSVPQIPVDINLMSYFTQPPWNSMLMLHMYFSFAAIGFFYLLPTDLLFSLWFFFLVIRAEDVITAMLGYQPEVMPMYGDIRAFVAYQLMGCYFMLVGYMAWTARPHLAAIWRAAWGRRHLNDPDDSNELLPYRFAFWGLISSVIGCTAWFTLFGMSWWLALFEICVVLFIVEIVLARSTSEGGMLMTETCFRPTDVYRMFGNVHDLGAANMTGIAFLDAVWMRDQRGLPITAFLDSMKFADGVRVKRRSLLWVFGLAFIVAIVVAGYLHITLPYRIGADQMYGYVYQGNPVWAFNDAAIVLQGNRGPLPWFDTLNFFIGAFITMIMVFLRTELIWFPLHPLGYALSGSWTIAVFWFPCMAAWLCKSLILRYGGMRLYSKARPFFLGMVLGEFTLGVLWSIPCIFWRTPTPFFPWP
jgi:hypothetical protein